jgi:penicillin-binding protein 1A
VCNICKWLVGWADSKGYALFMLMVCEVRTTLDANIQKLANQAVNRQLAQLQSWPAGSADQRRPAVLQAGFGTRPPLTAAQFLSVNSRDFAQRQFDHVSQSAPPAKLNLQAFRFIKRSVHF